MAILNQVFRKFQAFVTPLFAYGNDEARPGRVNNVTGGLEVHIVGGSAGGGGESGGATENTLLSILASSEAIQTALGAPNQETTQELLLAAVEGLGAGKTMADLAQALSDDAATQALILGVLQSLKIDTTTLASSLETLEMYTDDLEGYAERTADAVENYYAKLAAPLGAWTDQDPITVPVEPSPAQQLGNHPCSEIQLIADAANTHPIYVSGAGASSTKTLGLDAEDVAIEKRVENANQFYVVAAVGHTGQKLRYRTR